MSKDINFWNSLSGMYNKMFSNNRAYKKMYVLMKKALKEDMKVLEIGTASGIVAREISSSVEHVYAIDYAPDMIEKAKELTTEDNVLYFVQDSSNLQFSDKEFDAVIISNVIHILEQREACLSEIKRVLKDDGVLIAPTFMWKEVSLLGRIQQFIMKRRQFPVYSIWNTDEYLQFLDKNGFECNKHISIKSSFNICYAECKKKK